MIKRSLKICTDLSGAVITGAVILFLLFCARLAFSPIPLNFMNDYIESSIAPPDSGMRFNIEQMQMEWDGDHQSIVLRIHTMQAYDSADQLLATFPDLAIGISLQGLLFGNIAPSRVILISPSLTVIRYADGHFGFSPASETKDQQQPSAGYGNLVGDLFKALSNDGAVRGLEYLRRVEIKDGDILFDDQKNQVSFWAPKVDLEVKRTRKGIFGKAALNVELNEKITRFQSSLSWPDGSDVIVLGNQFDNIDLTHVAELLPELRDFAFLRTPISGNLNATVAKDGALRSFDFIAKGGKGTIEQSQLFTQNVPIQNIDLDVHYDEQGNLNIKRAHFDFGNMNASINGKIHRQDGQHQIQIQAQINNVDLKDLDMYWPQSMAKDARDWVVPNIKSGHVGVAKAELKARAPENDIAALTVDSVAGEIQFDNVTVDYFNPLPVATGLVGVANFDADQFRIKSNGGKANGISIGESNVVIKGLSQEDQDIDIAVKVSGNLTQVLEIIDYEPLRLPSRRDIKPHSIRGTFTADVGIKFPLLKDLQLEQLAIDVKGDMQKVYYDAAFWDFPLSRGVMKAVVTDKDMEISGDAYLAGLPIGLLWREDFRDRPQKFRSQYIVNSVMPDIGVKILDLPQPIPISGTSELDVDYAIVNGNESRLNLKANLTKTAIAVPQANWFKEPGVAASGRLDLILSGGALKRIGNFNLSSKDVKIEGEADFAEKNTLSQLQITQLQTPNNNAQIIMKRERADTYAINIWGNRFDAAHIYNARGGDADKSMYTIDMNIANLSLGGIQDFINVKSRKVIAGGEFESMRLTASTIGQNNQTVPVEASIIPSPGGRKVLIKSDDAGSLLRAAGLFDTMHGGKILIEGSYGEGKSKPPLNGNISIFNFSVKDAPVLATLLNLSSLPGILQNLSGQGIGFEKLVTDFKLQKDILTVKKARINGSSIGLKADGVLDLNRGLYDLDGILIPANDINKVISEIPLLGPILTAGGEQPLFAFNYSIKGPLSEPRVNVNPLSALTPGILREVFDNK